MKKSKKLPYMNTAALVSDALYAEIASTGQAPTHTPQSMQPSLIVYTGLPSTIASTGHSGTHAPQEIHSLLIV